MAGSDQFSFAASGMARIHLPLFSFLTLVSLIALAIAASLVAHWVSRQPSFVICAKFLLSEQFWQAITSFYETPD
jgi:hypothetical protein